MQISGKGEALAPEVILDVLDRGIVRLLRRDGRAGNQELAHHLGVTAATISARIRRLEEERLMQVRAISDFAAHGLDVLLAVGVRVAGHPPGTVARALADIPEILSVHAMRGPEDVEILVALHSFSALNPFLTGRLAAVPGIHSLHPAVAADIVKFGFETAPLLAGGQEPLLPVGGGPLDATDQQILAQLRQDARVSNRQLAAMLAITEGTVRGRLKRLQEARLLRFTAVTDFRVAGNPSLVMLGIHAEPAAVGRLAGELAAIDALNCVIVLSGRYNLLAMGLFTSIAELSALVEQRIRPLRGVRRVESAVSVESLKYEAGIARLT